MQGLQLGGGFRRWARILVLRQETSNSPPDGFRARGHLPRRRNKYRLGLVEADHRFRVTRIDRSGFPSCAIAPPYWCSQRLKIDRDLSALRLHQPSGLYPPKHGVAGPLQR